MAENAALTRVFCIKNVRFGRSALPALNPYKDSRSRGCVSSETRSAAPHFEA